jgi:hypothetical protein
LDIRVDFAGVPDACYRGMSQEERIEMNKAIRGKFQILANYLRDKGTKPMDLHLDSGKEISRAVKYRKESGQSINGRPFIDISVEYIRMCYK